MSEESEVVRFPRDAVAPIFYPVYVTTNENYRRSLEDRSWKLAPIVWGLVEGGPQVTWERAACDKNYREQTAKCIATCELMVRLLDVITSPIARHDHKEL